MFHSFLPSLCDVFMTLDLNRSDSLYSERLLVVLRDGRTLLGYLRSVDQFANLVLHRTVERIYVGKKYGDMDRGVFIVRGENVCLLGEIVSSKFVFDLCKANLNPATVQGGP